MKDINAGSGSEDETIEEVTVLLMRACVSFMALKNRYVLNNDASMQITIAERSKEELDELIVKLKAALKGMQL